MRSVFVRDYGSEVEVDPETGKVTVLEVTAAQDVGFALNPLVIEGQFQGSIAMGGRAGFLPKDTFGTEARY